MLRSSHLKVHFSEINVCSICLKLTSWAEEFYPSGAPEVTPCFCGIYVVHSIVYYAMCFFLSSFVLLCRLAIVFSVLQYTASDYHFRILKQFFENVWHLKVLSFMWSGACRWWNINYKLTYIQLQYNTGCDEWSAE